MNTTNTTTIAIAEFPATIDTDGRTDRVVVVGIVMSEPPRFVVMRQEAGECLRPVIVDKVKPHG